MMYEYQEYHELREGLRLHIYCYKPEGSPVWMASAHLVPSTDNSIVLIRAEYPEIRTAEQFAEMLRAMRSQSALELERWGGVVARLTSITGGVL